MFCEEKRLVSWRAPSPSQNLKDSHDMPTRHLTDIQRQSFARFDGDPSPEQLARCFHLDRTDRELVGKLRGDHNRLGFAVMLTSARFLGVFPSAADDIPASVMASLIEHNLEPATAIVGYFEGSRRVRHLALIRLHYGFTDFGDNSIARFRLTRWLYALCWSGDDRPGPLIDRAAAWLIANKVLLPGVTVLERMVGSVRDRAQTRLWRQLVASLSDDQRGRIARLFEEGDTSAFAVLDALRTVPTKRTPTEFYRHLDRLEAVRAFDLRPSPPNGVPAAALERLARVARVGKPSAIAALREPRRTATVAALFHTLEAAAQDDAAELAEALLTDLIKDAEAADKQARMRGLRDLDDAAILLREMGLLVMADDELPLNDWRNALFEQLPRASLEAAMAKVDAIAKPTETKPYAQLRARWRRARRLFFNITTRIEIDTAPGGRDLKVAINYLKAVADWSSAKMRDAPTAAIPKAWRQHVLDQDGKVRDSRAYVFALIDAWRLALKRRDVFAKPGIRYGDPRRGMLEGQTWQESRLMIARARGRSLDAATEIDGLSRRLDDAFRKVGVRSGDNPDLRFETVDGKSEIVVSPLDRLADPESLRMLRSAVQMRMPKAGIPDIFLEVMARTGFAKTFTHLSEREAKVENFEVSLCAALVGEACNIGLEPLVRPDVPALRRDRLSWIGQNFIRPETIAAANAAIVAAHSRLPIVGQWGGGEVASADGMRFVAPASAIHAGANPKYFGQGRGVTWYNMISDQFSGLGSIVIPGTLRDSLMVLALLLEQETELEPLEIMTDTAAYSDAIFGLFWLLGYQFSPRLADVGGAKLWRIDRGADYGPFDPIARGTINTSLIRENWGDLIRLAGSLKLGHLKATGVMRMLQVKDRPTTLARALSELGRIIKTMHILRYIDDQPFRRRILTQLNRQELRHKLGRRVHHGDRGEIRSSLRQESRGATRSARSGPQRHRPLERHLHARGAAPARRPWTGPASRRYRTAVAHHVASHQFPRPLRILPPRRRRKRRPQAAPPT
jgi:TnpA family transposase